MPVEQNTLSIVQNILNIIEKGKHNFNGNIFLKI